MKLTQKLAMQQALGFLVQAHTQHGQPNIEAQERLRAALVEQEADVWLTKEMMADYLDLIAEAIEDNRSEFLRHKAHWMRVRGEV